MTDAARRYLELAGGGPLRVEAFLDQEGPDLADERERMLADKEGLELEQGELLADVLADPEAGAHLVDSMLRPTAEALERLDDFRATGVADLGAAHLRREGRAGVLELRNPRHLNAEDEATLPATEVAVDLALLDPEIEIGVFRGGLVEHPRYAGRRIFGAGINLTLLYRGRRTQPHPRVVRARDCSTIPAVSALSARGSSGPGDYSGTDDVREIWWDHGRISTQNNKQGAWVQLNDGARYLPGGIPQGPAPWFSSG